MSKGTVGGKWLLVFRAGKVAGGDRITRFERRIFFFLREF